VPHRVGMIPQKELKFHLEYPNTTNISIPI
jgi:hypothetical protein